MNEIQTSEQKATGMDEWPVTTRTGQRAASMGCRGVVVVCLRGSHRRDAAARGAGVRTSTWSVNRT